MFKFAIDQTAMQALVGYNGGGRDNTLPKTRYFSSELVVVLGRPEPTYVLLTLLCFVGAKSAIHDCCQFQQTD